MKGISQFFDKYKSSAVKEIQKRVIISEIFKSELKQDIPIEGFTFKNGIITIKAVQSLKNQIFIKKQNIIRQIEKRIPGLMVKDIN